ELARARKQIGFDKLDAEEQALAKQMTAPDFWQDTVAAQKVSQQQAKLERRVRPWRELQKEVNDLGELAELRDETLLADLREQTVVARQHLDTLKEQLKLSGEYDDAAAILSIHAGAGGTDAQDWAQMLLRMYVRHAESHDMKVSTLESSSGDEAGLK